jgi:hypothetical protein
LLVGLGALLIAFMQWKIARDKLKLDLYNKRFAIYVAALETYQVVTKSYDIEQGEKALTALVKATREARFLFERDSGIYELLTTFHKASSRMNERNRLEQSGESEDRLKAIRKVTSDYITSGEEILLSLEKMLAPYLDFHAIYGLGWRRRLTKLARNHLFKAR